LQSVLREIAKRGGARDEAGAAARSVAEAVLAHLLLCGWRPERPERLAPHKWPSPGDRAG
jgi:hypothetical protein